MGIIAPVGVSAGTMLCYHFQINPIFLIHFAFKNPARDSSPVFFFHMKDLTYLMRLKRLLLLCGRQSNRSYR
jgi:hypothetical protein